MSRPAARSDELRLPRHLMEVEELASPTDPLSFFSRIRTQPYALLLDSGTDPHRLGRHSFATANPWAVVRSKGRLTEVLDWRDGTTKVVEDDPLRVARELASPWATDPIADIPPFQGGVAGYIGYDYGATLERLPSPRYDDLAVFDVVLGLYDEVTAWDHVNGRAWRITHDVPRRGQPRAQDESLFARTTPTPAPSYVVPDHPQLRSSFTHDAYLRAVQRVREYIVAGDIYQANLSQRLEAPFTGDPWALYTRLRSINPAPFAAYFNAGETVVVSASPERFLRLTPGGAVETRPIKGTNPRGFGPEHDAALGQALTESEKDRAEHVMIVDLLRNDLSRVCALHSVSVPELFTLERYATVHHLVSTVVGQLRPGTDAVDLLHAAFPGGSITGAPKIRAMEIIAELEPSRRGVYCGAVGYWSVTGALDTSIVIRTYVIRHGRAYFSVGGGIVADSDPESEYRETLDKARALIAAVT